MNRTRFNHYLQPRPKVHRPSSRFSFSQDAAFAFIVGVSPIIVCLILAFTNCVTLATEVRP